MKGVILKLEICNIRFNLIFIEEETIIRYILDLDSRGFPLRIDNIEDITNSLFAIRFTKRVSK